MFQESNSETESVESEKGEKRDDGNKEKEKSHENVDKGVDEIKFETKEEFKEDSYVWESRTGIQLKSKKGKDKMERGSSEEALKIKDGIREKRDWRSDGETSGSHFERSGMEMKSSKRGGDWETLPGNRNRVGETRGVNPCREKWGENGSDEDEEWRESENEKNNRSEEREIKRDYLLIKPNRNMSFQYTLKRSRIKALRLMVMSSKGKKKRKKWKDIKEFARNLKKAFRTKLAELVYLSRWLFAKANKK